MSTENVISRNPVTWPHSGKQKSRPGSKGVAMRASTTVSLLGFLLVASQVGSGHASYPCTSDADCQYEGCNDKDCSTAVSTHPNIGRCNGGRWDAECTCSWSCTCKTWGPHGYLTTCAPKRDCPDRYLFSHEGMTAHFASLPDSASYDREPRALSGIATSAIPATYA